MKSSASSSAASTSSNSNVALLAYEFRVALKRNKSVLLKLFEKGRQVQPTDHVIRTVAPFTLRSPVVSKEVTLLGDILDPNKTGFVTLKRVRELVTTHDDESDGEEDGFDHDAEGKPSALTIVAKARTRPRQMASVKRTQDQKWIPPKRAPPTSNASLYAVSTALSLVPHARDTKDPDMLAIMTAIQWSGKHLSQPSSIERRLLASTPLSRYAVPIPTRMIPSAQEEVAFPLLSEAMRRFFSDEDRGWSAAAIVATHVRSEVVFRDLVRREVPEILVPEDILQAFLSTPRWYRQQVLDSTKPGSANAPHDMFRGLSAVRLPLVVTALRVEMDSASRKVMNAFLPLDVAGAWARSSERERSAFVTALLDLGLWDAEFFTALGGSGMEPLLLTRSGLALPGPSLYFGEGLPRAFSMRGEDPATKAEVQRLAERIEEISRRAREPLIRPAKFDTNDHGNIGTVGEVLASSDDPDDVAVLRLREKIATLTEEILL